MDSHASLIIQKAGRRTRRTRSLQKHCRPPENDKEKMKMKETGRKWGRRLQSGFWKWLRQSLREGNRLRRIPHGSTGLVHLWTWGIPWFVQGTWFLSFSVFHRSWYPGKLISKRKIFPVSCGALPESRWCLFFLKVHAITIAGTSFLGIRWWFSS